jgi:hypothetical protein
MRYAILRLLFALALGAPALAAQRAVDLRWALDADGAVKVFNYVGRVRVVGWDRDSVVVTGTTASHLRMFGGGSRAGIKLGTEGDQRTAADSAILVVRVPVGANVWVRGAATDIEVEGLIGTVDVGTVSGRVSLRGSPRSAMVETMDGTLQVRGAPTVLRAKTASGRLEFTGAAREAVLGTVSGTVFVRGGPLGRTRIETVAGAVDLDATLETDAQLTIETHSGDIVAYVPKGSLSKVIARSFRGAISVREK